MPRFDFMFFGYFTVTVETEDIAKASAILLKAGFGAKFDRFGRFSIPYGKKTHIEELFNGKIKYCFSEPRGLFGFLIKHKLRFGIYLAILLMSVVFLISSDTVWDVRIEGVESGEEAGIVKELSLAGLEVGKRWSRIDKSEIEINVLSESKDIAWVNINRRGTVAYVTVGRKITYNEQQIPSGYANIVAARDCVIEEIIVERGYPMVKKGESVRAGEVIISGVIPEELGGGFCYAYGTVTGRYSDTLSVSTDRETVEKKYSQPILCGTKLVFFGKELNIFKKYRQQSDKCDIIEKTEDITFVKRLPIAIKKNYLHPYETITATLSDDQLILSCSKKFREELNSYLSDKEAKRLSVKAELFDGGYRIDCDMVVCAEISKIQEFKVE